MLPLLDARMLLPRRTSAGSAFPFDHPNVRYTHFARNAIYFLPRHFGLSGTEMLVPAYFHGVEVEALTAAGVRPRFYPVRSRMRVDPQDVLDRLTPETRAIYLIHYVGFPGPARDLQAICRERGILLIEDCALGLLSKLDHEPLGTFGDASVFCLYKTLPTPDGGAVVLRSGALDIAGRPPRALGTTRETVVSILRRQAMRAGPLQLRAIAAMRAVAKALAPPKERNWVDVGTQRFNPADARLLMSRTTRRIIASQDFCAIVEARRRNYLHLQDCLRDVAPPVFPSLPRGVCPLFYPFETRHKHALWARLQWSGVQAVLFWLHGEFSPPRGAFPEVDVMRDTVLELPCHQDMTADEIERMASLVRNYLAELGD
jgi:dTDP-4-amino-4,6-dideoxygalactose transaminase